MASYKLYSWAGKKLHAAAVNKIKQMVLPYVNRGCLKLSERSEFQDCRLWLISKSPQMISEKVANTTRHHVAEMLSAYFANGLVAGFCTGTCASWLHLSNVRGEAFRKSKEAYDASVKQYADGMNRPVLRRQEQYNPLGEIVEQSERKEGLNVVLGVNDHHSEKKACGNQECGGVENAEEELHLNLAILISLLHSKKFFDDESSDKHIRYVKTSFPELKFSKKDMEDRIDSLEQRFKETRKTQGENPKMGRRIEREIYDLSMILWGKVHK